VEIDDKSIIDLNPFVKNGHLNWRVPSGSDNWKIFAFWEGVTNQVSCSGGVNGTTTIEKGSLVVDHFSKAGAKLHTSFFDQHVLTGKRIRENLRRNGRYGEPVRAIFGPGLRLTNRSVGRQHGTPLCTALDTRLSGAL
jgi:hypothetical protein